MYEALRLVKDLREDIQKHRIALQLRLHAIADGRMEASVGARAVFESYYAELQALEKRVAQTMHVFREEYPLFGALCQLRGISDVLAARLLSELGDPLRFANVSKLWRFSGYAVIDGGCERLRAGEPARFSRRLKTTCYLIANSFIKQKGAYREYYDYYRAYYGANRADWTAARQHMASLRKVSKVFLWHVYQAAHRLAGLPTPISYAATLDDDRRGHATMSLCEDFGWEGLPPALFRLNDGRVCGFAEVMRLYREGALVLRRP